MEINTKKSPISATATRPPAAALFLLFVSFWALSYILLYAYVGGDQVHYHRFYDALANAPLVDIMHLANAYVSSSEPVSAFLLWVGAATGVDKNIYISFLNAILLVSLFVFIKRYGVAWYVILLVFTNFYILVLLTGAERLKISYIFMLFSILSSGWGRGVWAALSPLAHLQSLIVIVSYYLGTSSNGVRRVVSRGVFSKKYAWASVFFVFMVFAFVLMFQSSIVTKAEAYMEGGVRLSDGLRILGLSIVLVFVLRDKLGVALSMLPLAVAAVLIGDNRVNIMAISIAFFFLLSERKMEHPLILILFFYLSAKSVPFVYNIFVYGNGFGGFLF